MCILCVVQKWSRRVATMLPWLVIPLIGLWAVSQLLPPSFRFEVTSPRLACVLVLLVTIFWYEILVPQLSAWRARRNALNREKMRYEAIEMQKLRKTATRLCRNCVSPYKDQNPSGGRFTCSYCGHVSKRPALDLSGGAETKVSNTGVFDNLVIKSGKAKVRYSCRGKDGGEDRCSDFFACKRLTSFFLSIRWTWIKTLIASVLSHNDSLDGDFDGMSKKGDAEGFCESKGEKARRKAEEKRQARLEREQLEEEERKQREEVARLVEERRRLKDEILSVERERIKGSATEKRKDSKRESERKRQERRKEKDRGSSKSNSDVEDLDRRSAKENEKKRDFDIERRDISKTVSESIRFNSSEFGIGAKVATTNNFSRVTGAKYLERMKGSFLSSSKAFNGSSFFGKGAHSSTNVVSKTNKLNGSVDYANWKDSNSSEHMPRKLNSNGGDKITATIPHRPVASQLQPQATPKKSWQQLFTRTPVAPLSSNANVIGRSDENNRAVERSPQLACQLSPTLPLDSQIPFKSWSPFSAPSFPNGSISGSSIFSSAAEPMFPSSGKLFHEEPEVFEDPCYIPDPISLLGPVSESLDNFPLDPVNGFATDTGLGSLHSLRNVCVSTEVNRPSPIESPMSRSKVMEERRMNCSQYPSSPNNQDMRTSFLNDSINQHEHGTWQMWGTPPLGQDGLGFVGGPVNWLSPLGQNTSKQEEFTHPLQNTAMSSGFATENMVLPVTCPAQTIQFSDCQDGGTFSHLGPCSRNEMMHGSPYGSPSRSATSHPFEPSPINCWFKNKRSGQDSGEGSGNSTTQQGMPEFAGPDVDSFWS